MSVNCELCICVSGVCLVYVVYLYCVSDACESDFNAAADLSPIDICDVVRHNSNLPLRIQTQCIAMFHLSLDLTQPEGGKIQKNKLVRIVDFFKEKTMQKSLKIRFSQHL